MLEALDTISWNELKTSFSRSASDVPTYIRQLLSLEPAVRKKAVEDLGWDLCNTYILGTATLAAIPFLIELLEHDGIQDKHRICHLLLDCFIRSEATPEEMAHPETQLEVQVGQSITKGLDIYIRHLEHPDWETRMAAALLLVEGNFPRSEWQRLKVVYEKYKTQEKHPTIRKAFERWDLSFASVLDEKAEDDDSKE